MFFSMFSAVVPSCSLVKYHRAGVSEGGSISPATFAGNNDDEPVGFTAYVLHFQTSLMCSTRCSLKNVSKHSQTYQTQSTLDLSEAKFIFVPSCFFPEESHPIYPCFVAANVTIFRKKNTSCFLRNRPLDRYNPNVFCEIHSHNMFHR